MTRLLYFVYSALTALAWPFLLLLFLLQAALHPAARGFFLGRLALLLPSAPPARQRRVWIHAASIGEVLSCIPLISRFTAAGQEVYLSTGTRAGLAAALRHLAPDKVFILPLDYPWCIRRVLHRLKPDLLLICEVEIWPALARCIKTAGLPLYLVSGRMPEADFRAFRRWRLFFSRVLAQYDGLFMQSAADEARMRRLCDHPNLQSLGNLKFDVAPAELKPDLAALVPPAPLLCGASTHPGEERLILEAFARLRKHDRRLRLILAPLDPLRTVAIARLAGSLGLDTALRSSGRRTDAPVFLLDSTGELPALYARCDLVIMGGTFSKRTGGHNIIEPAQFGKCILCGPHMANFQEAFNLFSRADALVLTSREQLELQLGRLLAAPEKAKALGARAQALVEQHRGASLRIFDAVGNGGRHPVYRSSKAKRFQG